MRFIKLFNNLLTRHPLPGFAIAILLSIRWKCRVSLRAEIHFPSNVIIGKNARIGKCQIIATGEGVVIGESVSIGEGVILDALGGSVSIGDFTSIGPLVVVYGQGGLNLGRYNMLAAHSILVASSHIYSSIETPIKLQGTTAAGIKTGDDVWIGANAVIQDGVLLGRGVIVGSGAVVRANFDDYSVIAGVPAKLISIRG